VAYIGRVEGDDICFDTAVETSSSLSVDAYSSSAHTRADDFTISNPGYTLVTNSLTATAFGSSGDVTQPCEVTMTFSSDPGDKDYMVGDVDSFTHDAATYTSGTCSGGTVTYSAELTSGAAIPTFLSHTSSSKTFSFTSAVAGTYEIVIIAEDPDSGTTFESESFTLTVSENNSAPTWDSTLSDTSVEVNSSETLSIPGVSDVDVADSHSYLVTLSDDSALPAGLITFDDINLEIDITPTDNSEAMDYEVKVYVEDDDTTTAGADILSASFTFTVTITPFNSIPTFDTLDDISYDNFLGSYTYQTNCVDHEDAGDGLVLMESGGSFPSFVSISGLTLIINPYDVADINTYTVSVTCEDNDSIGSGTTKSVTESFELNIEGVNTSPYFSTSLDD
jgi:hypothetical protein